MRLWCRLHEFRVQIAHCARSKYSRYAGLDKVLSRPFQAEVLLDGSSSNPQDKDIDLLDAFITLGGEWFANYERKAWERFVLR
jgi:hypothetical protein